MLAEFTIGRRTGLNPVGAFRALAPGTPWVVIGFMGVLAGFIGVDARDIHGLEFKREDGRAYLLGPPEAEDGKINVNCAYAHSDKDPKLMRLVASLQALFADPRYDPLFEEADDQGNFNDRETVIRAIVDFVDPDQVMFGQPSAPEDYGYETLPDPYEAKNNLLDSVQDIRLIRGVTDDFWANFGPSLTIYGHCIPNICAIPDDNWMLMAAILYQSARNPQDPVFSDPIRLRALSQAVLNTVKISGCKDLNVLVQAARNPVPVSTMAAMLGGSTSSSDESVVGMLEGIELDPAKVMQAAYAGPRRYYRVVAVGEAGGVVRTITAVWDQQFRSPSTGQMGAFVYFRID